MPIIFIIFAPKFTFLTLKLHFMNQFEIKVFRILATGKEQVLMCRRCSFKSSDYFPFETIEASLRIIFGKDCFISFIVCPYEKC